MVWYADSTVADKKSLQQVICSAEKIISCSLPSLDDTASSRHLSRDKNIIKNSTHPGHEQFQLLPSGRHHRSAKTCTSSFKDCLSPRTIRALNSRINNNYRPHIMMMLLWTEKLQAIVIHSHFIYLYLSHMTACAKDMCDYMSFMHQKRTVVLLILFLSSVTLTIKVVWFFSFSAAKVFEMWNYDHLNSTIFVQCSEAHVTSVF